MYKPALALPALLLLLSACNPSAVEEALITFYEEDSETTSETNTDTSDQAQETTETDASTESETSDTDETSDEISSEDCTSYSTFEDGMLCQHNYIRAYGTNPEPESALQPLTWNTDLEDVARGHAEACVYEHNAERSDSISGYVGENIAATTWDAGAVAIVNLWADEVEYYDYENNSCADDQQCGHYTQIVWSDTTEVGCAVSYCSTLENTGWSTGAYFYVCNYSPGGNYVGEQPY